MLCWPSIFKKLTMSEVLCVERGGASEPGFRRMSWKEQEGMHGVVVVQTCWGCWLQLHATGV